MAGLKDNIIAAYSFENGTGTTLTDLSGSGYTGTLSTATNASGTITSATYIAGTVGTYALDFAGVGNVSIANPNEVSSSFVSVFCWAKKTSDGNGCIISHGDHYSGIDTRSWNIFSGVYPSTNDDKLRFNFASSGTAWAKVWTTNTAVLADGLWHHIGFTFNAGTPRIYIDGAYYSNVTKSTDNTMTSIVQSTAVLRIGAQTYNGASDQPFEGAVDEVNIYNRVLTDAEVATLYAKTDVNNGLICRYSFEEGSGSTALNTKPTTSPIWSTGKVGNYGLEFDGTRDSVELSTAPTLTSISVSSQTTEPRNLWFKPDGLKMFLTDTVNDKVLYYTLGTAWDISTLTYVGAFTTGVSDPYGIYINSDGTKFWLVSPTTDTVRQYSMTAWDMSTASYDSKTFSTVNEDTGMNAICFNNTGSKMYLGGTTKDRIYQYTLSTPFDVSTASYDSVSKYIGVFEGGVKQIFFNSDGTKLYIGGDSGDAIYEWNLGTAWDISTLTTLGKRIHVGFIETALSGIFFKSDGMKIYFTGTTTDKIYEYPLISPYEFCCLENVQATEEVKSVYRIHCNQLGVTTNLSEGAIALRFNSDGTKMYLLSTSTYDSAYQFSLSTAYDTRTAVYDTKFYTFTEDTAQRDIFFKEDGTKLYMLGATNDRIYQYSMSSAWDISTLSYDSVNTVTNIGSAGSTDVNSIFFSPDGVYLYMACTGSNYYYQYTLSTPWLLSSAAYTNKVYINSETDPRYIWFNSTGTLMFVGGSYGPVKCTLSTPWDISTATVTGEILSCLQESSPYSFKLSPDGTKAYLVGTAIDSINQYTLDTPWSFSTGTGGITISAWIKPFSAGESNQGRIFGCERGTGGDSGVRMYQSSTQKFAIAIDAGSGPYSLDNSVPLNTWSHVVSVINANGKVKNYVNGISANAFPLMATHSLDNFTLQKIRNSRIGGSAGSSVGTGVNACVFDGIIDEFMFFDKELSDEEVLRVYNSGIGSTYPIDFEVNVAVSGKGLVTINPDEEYYAYGDTVLVTPGPTIGNYFNTWQGNVTSEINPLTLNITQEYTLTSEFVEYSTVRSKTVYLNATPVTKARISVVTTSDVNNFIFGLSNNGGVTMEEVTNSTDYTFIDPSGEEVQYQIWGKVPGTTITKINVKIN